jgi:hypothetical protein
VAKVYYCDAVNFSWDNLYDSGKNIMNERIRKLLNEATSGLEWQDFEATGGKAIWMVQ